MLFSYANPTQILFGQGQIAAISKQIPTDRRVLLVYGGGSIKKNGVYDQVIAALSKHQMVEFAGIEPNPTIETLDKAVQLARESQTDFILAVGGGSVIDGAKYIAAAIHHEGDGWDILLGKQKIKQATPIGAILTIPATGSESNNNSVVTKAATHEKLSFASALVRPQFAVMDPQVMQSLPERLLANGVVDAFVHVCEQYLTFPAGHLVQDGYAEALLRTLATLAKTFSQRDDQWHANLMWAANQALNGLIGVGVAQDWATHMIGHELTATYGVDHARSLAIVQPSLLRHQLAHKRAKLEQMGQNVFGLSGGADLAERTIDQIEQLYQSVDVATQLTEYQAKGQSKDQAIEQILGLLQQHGMLKLGEHQAIDLQASREILTQAVA